MNSAKLKEREGSKEPADSSYLLVHITRTDRIPIGIADMTAKLTAKAASNSEKQ